MIKTQLRSIPFLLIISLLLALGTSCDLIKKETPQQIYNKEMEVFKKNEAETLPFYGTVTTTPRATLLLQLESQIIPKWKQNEQILLTISKISGLSQDLKIKNQQYQQYVNMRLQSMELLRKSLAENTAAYSHLMENMEQDIRNLVETL